MQNHKLLQIWVGLLGILGLIVTFELGLYLSNTSSRDKINSILLSSTSNIAQLESTVGIKNGEIQKLNQELQTHLTTKNSLEQKVDSLEGEVAGLQTNKSGPFVIPTSGTVGTFNGTFGGNMYGMRHLGIDIWTTTDNGGRISSHVGNPVFAACNGIVENIDPQNAGITILCDPIDRNKYALPAYDKVYTHYAHLGNAETKALYIDVHGGQRIKQGQKIGRQGDLSSYFPEMRNVHLHFSVFTGLSETDKSGGALNPCLYIGGDCSRAGETFKAK